MSSQKHGRGSIDTEISVPSKRKKKATDPEMSPLGEAGARVGTNNPANKSVKQRRAQSPVPSCVSVKSDRSMEIPLKLKGQGTNEPSVKRRRAQSPAPSCTSVKSDRSMEIPLKLKGQGTNEPSVQQRRAPSPVPSCESVKSGRSMEIPLKLKGQGTDEPRVSSFTVEKPDKDMDFTLIKKSLQHTLEKLKKDELRQFRSHLSQDHPECFQSQMEDHEAMSVVEKMLESCGRERSVELTLHILRNMNLKDLADSLERDDPKSESKRIQHKLKTKLEKRFECIFEVLAKQDHPTLLNTIYTELYITEGESGGVNSEHEVVQIERMSKCQIMQETTIHCEEIFKSLPGQSKPIRTVLTKGIAGIGKSVSVQKFILDWAEGKANQDIHFIFPLPFRDLNMMKGTKFSLMQLLQHYFPEVKDIESVDCDEVKVAFIFDGLDEYRFPLDFQNSEILCDVTQSTSVDILLTNLIKGNLLPSASIWITSRPAAASQIPSEYIHRVTEVRGFKDPQKEQYFRKRIRDQNLASKVVSHIKASRSLYIMCHLPVFCWISATVLERILGEADCGEIPKTLTEMCTHFLLIQTNVKNQKYHGTSETSPKKISTSDIELILKLGKLAFHHLEKGNLIFYEEDLTNYGIDVSEASVYSGVCTEIFKEECGLYQEKVYCFVHLSIQEYLAALFVFLSHVKENRNVFKQENLRAQGPRLRLFELHKGAVDQALQSKNGHLDLFVRFLLGLSLESNERLLRELLTQSGRRSPASLPLSQTESTSQSTDETIKYIKEKIRKESSAERTINLFHCLSELKDNSLVEEIKTSLKSGTLSKKKLEPHQCSALAFVLLMSEEVQEVFDLKLYKLSSPGHQRLVSVVKSCRKAMLDNCNLTEKSCEIVAAALRSAPSHLTELDLSYNNLGDSGVEWLCAGMKSPNCILQRLRLSGCRVKERGCSSLASAMRSNTSHLKTLDLSENHPEDEGVRVLSAGLEDPSCKLETLLLKACHLKEGCCEALASVLRSPHSELRDLDLSNNELKDSGVKALSAGLQDPQCKLQRLRLTGCQITEVGCESLASALRTNPSYLKELDLSYNHAGDLGVEVLSERRDDPSCALETLCVDRGVRSRNKSEPRKFACQLTLDPNTANRNLLLSEGDRTVTWEEEKQPYPDHPERFDTCPQVLCREGLSGHSYWEVEWSGTTVEIGMAYKGINRKEGRSSSELGWNSKSWSLYITKGQYSVCHNKKKEAICPPASPSNRVGVYLDLPTGILSFYNVSSDTFEELHRFQVKFTEPLYPGFGVYGSSVFLCQVD